METFERTPQSTEPAHNEQEQFRLRMAAQMFRITCYRREQWLQNGRRLSFNQASAEWIRHYAADFPASVGAN